MEQRALDAMIASASIKIQALPESLAALQSQAQPRPSSRGAVAVVQIRGTIEHHASLWTMLFGGATTEAIGAEIQALVADESVRAIVLDIDSPGGQVAGTGELADEIYKARGKKPIVALANDQACSAAYWIASAADAIYATPSAIVGSIGVYIMHQDVSKAAEDAGIAVTYIQAGKYKTEANQFEPLGDEATQHLQEIVDDDYDRFVKAVARGRGVTEATVRNGYGQGRVLTAKRAKSLGMIDGIYTLEQAIARSVSITPGKAGTDEAAAEAEANERLAEEDAGRKRLALLRWRELQAHAEEARG
jgi:signal peptide peptidase SppA